MATYYVSKGGNDSNAGTGPGSSAAWLTITKAVQTAAAGDTVYVGSGVYRESPTNTNAGTSGSIIQFIADPDCKYCTSDNPGIVRVTSNGTDEIPVSGDVWICQKDYVEIIGFHIDGGYASGDYVLDRGATGNGRIARNCVFSGNMATNYGIYYNCASFSSSYGYNNSTCYDCFGVGRVAFNNCTSYGCLGIGSYSPFYTGTAYNCLGIGGYYGIRECTTYNCVGAFGYQGFYNGTAYNGYAIGTNQYAFNGVAKSNCKYVLGCAVATTGGSGDAPTSTATILWAMNDLQTIIEHFKPYMFEGVKQWATTSGFTVPDYDILGNVRQMIGGNLDIGPYAYSVEELDWSTYQTAAPSIKITQKGMKVFKLLAKGGTAITVTCKCKHQSTSGDKPQLILRGDQITTQTDTCIDTADTWDTLTVTATPTKDDELEIVLYARDTTSGAISYFSDISVS
jgi:hypothetical protein